MLSIAGYIMFLNSEDFSEKNKGYVEELFKKFPSSFHTRNNVSHAPLHLAGNFEYLTEAADQEHQVFFNGEIFNYSEIADSLLFTSQKPANNAALVLALILKKGIEAIKDINGQFLIIYLHKTEKKIYVVNDHFGISQFYYYYNKSVFLFGSELKFLLAHPDCPKAIDWETSLKRPYPNTFTSYKSYNTWFKEISLLPEASVLSLDMESGEVKINNYWKDTLDKNYDYSPDNRTAADVMQEYISLLKDAIKIRVADGAVCYSLLSGGLDSSAIAALATKYKPVETFSAITQVTWIEGTTSICNKLSQDLGISNTQFLLPVHQLFFNTELWKQRIWRAESPDNHTDSFTKTLLHYAIKKVKPEVNVLLTGTGSDQLNGGLARWMVQDAESKDNNWEQFHNAVLDIENNKLISREDSALWKRRNFINREFLVSISGNSVEKNSWLLYVGSALHAQAYSLLWDEARASASHGHSTRFPFLDFRFLPFVLQIPPRLHQELFFDKSILRVPIKNILPSYVIEKPKMASIHPDCDFRFELFNFLTGEDPQIIVEEALGPIDQPHPVINKKEIIKRIKKLQAAPEIYEWLEIMYIINLGLLEQLPFKTEKDMDMESSVKELQEITFGDAEKTNLFLEENLAIKKEIIDLQKPLLFTEGSFLLFDKLSNKYFLSKDNALKFEIEEQYRDWILFLNAINNRLSVQQILDELKIAYASIEEFLNLSVEEKILTTQETSM
jgi:asparagine synthase (glutamine-hydrolysing)